jgi:transcriptional regulator with XRE-family HTH domain
MLAKRVKEFRKQKGWSQQKLAEKTGLSFNTITKIEQGVGDSPTLKTLFKLANAFGIGLDELVGRKDNYGKS